MPVLDDRGRLFGKLNLIDAVVGVFLVIVFAVGYTAYLLFRTPIPTITSIEPAQIIAAQSASIQVTGAAFRPFLGAMLGTTSGIFLLQDPMHAEIKVPALPVGTYDLVLFDEALELARKRSALTVVPPVPPARPKMIPVILQLVGEFVDLSEDDAAEIRTGLTFGQETDVTLARVVATQPRLPDMYRLNVGGDAVLRVPKPGAFRVPAVLRVTCVLANEQCIFAGTAAVRGAMVTLPLAAGRPAVLFRIRDVLPAGAPTTL